jgi:hypothetical protein
MWGKDLVSSSRLQKQYVSFPGGQSGLLPRTCSLFCIILERLCGGCPFWFGDCTVHVPIVLVQSYNFENRILPPNQVKKAKFWVSRVFLIEIRVIDSVCE